MPTVERAIASITDDRRTNYLFDTKTAADAVGCHPNKFNDWWQRTKSKLIDLYVSEPGPLAAEIAGLFALAEVERQRRELQAKQARPLVVANHGHRGRP